MNTTISNERTPAGPLDGVRVIDLTSVVLGPMATQALADLGADVIKIEAPAGDMMRANGVVETPGMSSIFVALNRNKRSMVLDLKAAQDKEILRRLIANADVVIHNMRVQAIEKLGFGYETVALLNPRIVYCAATGYGQDGPYRDRPAFDDTIQAACGLVSTSSLDQQAPAYVPSLIADKTTGLALANAVLAALLYRERHGEGQYVEVPMLETMTAFLLTEHMGGMTFAGSAQPAGYARLLDDGRQPVRTADGWISLLPYTERHWHAFFNEVGRQDLSERYDISDRARRNRHIKTLYGHLRELAVQRTTADWIAVCDRLDIPATPIYGLDELPSHPHLKAVGLFQETSHPVLGPLREIRPATRFFKTPTSIRRPAPMLGEHTEEILATLGPARAQAEPPR